MAHPSKILGSIHYERLCRVYFVEAPSLGLIKIGFALHVMKRFSALLHASPVPLTLLADMPGGRRLEERLHIQFAHQWSHGEWFRKTPELEAIIAAAPTRYGNEWQNRKVA